MSKPRYLVDSSVLPPEYYEAIRASFNNKKQVISFKKDADDDTFTKTELLLNDTALVKKCRAWLHNNNAEVRNIYFRGQQMKDRAENPNIKLALWLSEQGHTSQAVADAIGVSRITISRWVKAVRPRGRPGHFKHTNDTALVMLGVERLLENKGVDDVDILTYGDIEPAAKILAEKYKTSADKLLVRAEATGSAYKQLQEYKC